MYRRVVTKTIFGDVVHYELAASSGWKRSDARDVSWMVRRRTCQIHRRPAVAANQPVSEEVRPQSPKAGAPASSAVSALPSWWSNASGITNARIARFTTPWSRFEIGSIGNLEVAHPVTPGDYITSGTDDARARSFRDKLTDAIDALQPLLDSDCTRERALKCWDKVFATTFFSERLEDEKRASVATPAIVTSAAILSSTAPAAAAVNSAGGGRYA